MAVLDSVGYCSFPHGNHAMAYGSILFMHHASCICIMHMYNLWHIHVILEYESNAHVVPCMYELAKSLRMYRLRALLS